MTTVNMMSAPLYDEEWNVRDFKCNLIAAGVKADAQAIADAVFAMTAAGSNTAGWFSVPLDAGDTEPVAAEPFNDVTDKAVLVFYTDNAQQYVTVSIPAPLEALFLADDDTVDPDGLLLADLETAMIDKAAAPGGAAVSGFYYGYRLKRGRAA
jgi:hypothetical protein